MTKVATSGERVRRIDKLTGGDKRPDITILDLIIHIPVAL